MRSRRSLILSIGLLLVVLFLATGVIVSFIKQVPAFYAAGAKPANYDTREKASRLMTRVQDLKNDIRTKGVWGETFTIDELNCFFAEMMVEKGGFSSLMPEGFHSPRIGIDGDKLKIGFRYGHGFWSTVIWIELRVWLVAEETNLMAVEVCDLCAGGMGVGAQSILDAIGDAARASNVDVVWYRHNGNPVGLFRFFPDQPRPASQVLTLDVHGGEIVIAGRSSSAEPIGTSPAP